MRVEEEGLQIETADGPTETTDKPIRVKEEGLQTETCSGL